MEGSSTERPMFLPMLGGLLIALLVSLLVAPVAGAHHLPVSVEWKAQRSVPIADAAWPQSPCAGRLQVRSGPEVDAGLDAAGLDGRQFPGTCVVEVRSTLRPVTFCTVTAHEAGHAAGMGHSQDPDDLMFALSADYGPCESLGQPVHLRALAREQTARWTSHRWRCRGTSRLQRCVGVGRRTVGVAEFRRHDDGEVEDAVSYRLRSGR